jgi:hypothetical protein
VLATLAVVAVIWGVLAFGPPAGPLLATDRTPDGRASSGESPRLPLPARRRLRRSPRRMTWDAGSVICRRASGLGRRARYRCQSLACPPSQTPVERALGSARPPLMTTPLRAVDIRGPRHATCAAVAPPALAATP